MKKPLLLLVDDDRAVLEALEAALSPGFEEIARVEAFDRSEDVLEAISRWTEEKRPIAVAVVDQKMPGITGGELLKLLGSDLTINGDPFVWRYQRRNLFRADVVALLVWRLVQRGVRPPSPPHRPDPQFRRH